MRRRRSERGRRRRRCTAARCSAARLSRASSERTQSISGQRVGMTAGSAFGRQGSIEDCRQRGKRHPRATACRYGRNVNPHSPSRPCTFRRNSSVRTTKPGVRTFARPGTNALARYGPGFRLGQPRWPPRAAGARRPRHVRISCRIICVPAAVVAVAIVLLLGLVNMMRGGSPNRSQKLMRLRVLLQFVAIIVIMATIWAMGR